jgi:hypothetical protein
LFAETGAGTRLANFAAPDFIPTQQLPRFARNAWDFGEHHPFWQRHHLMTVSLWRRRTITPASRGTGKLQHPNLVAVHNVFDVDDRSTFRSINRDRLPGP